ncbi:hypothetical protein HXX76_009699 [Chlamydomonas incerta]|uniref:Uncharacterized protein n=1 Tax=Chlamydomonas incerta TaxID=51695 RepID=A0A835VZZ4_CHLIN|nr:hypothetical protein HXX76_009699 [Chlamydomonas incerta]|eukprot:KAG2431171.1 hypothetical protein HXX76_009699 [Chlamydomonas incerta]
MQFGETGHVGFEEEKDDILAMGAVSVGCTAIKLHKLTCDNGWRFRGIRLTSAGRSRTMNILRQPAPLHVRQQRVFVVVKVGGQLHPVPAKLCDEELDQGSEAPVVSEADHNRLPGAQQQQSALPPYPQSPTSRPQQQACSWYLLLPASELSRRWGMAPHAGDAICGLDTYVAEGPAGGGPGGGGGGEALQRLRATMAEQDALPRQGQLEPDRNQRMGPPALPLPLPLPAHLVPAKRRAPSLERVRVRERERSAEARGSAALLAAAAAARVGAAAALAGLASSATTESLGMGPRSACGAVKPSVAAVAALEGGKATLQPLPPHQQQQQQPQPHLEPEQPRCINACAQQGQPRPSVQRHQQYEQPALAQYPLSHAAGAGPAAADALERKRDADVTGVAQAIAAAAAAAFSQPSLSWVIEPGGPNLTGAGGLSTHSGSSSGSGSIAGDGGNSGHRYQVEVAAAAQIILSLGQRLAEAAGERAELLARLEESERRLAAVRAAVVEGG